MDVRSSSNVNSAANRNDIVLSILLGVRISCFCLFLGQLMAPLVSQQLGRLSLKFLLEPTTTIFQQITLLMPHLKLGFSEGLPSTKTLLFDNVCGFYLQKEKNVTFKKKVEVRDSFGNYFGGYLCELFG